MESIIGKILCDRYRIIQELNSTSSLSSDTSRVPLQLNSSEVSEGKVRKSTNLALDSVSRIYLAEECSTEERMQCVIKRYQPQYDNEVLGSQSWQRVLQAFMTQGKILQKISQHPQIPQLLAFFECDREFYLVLEQIDGESLEQQLNDSSLNEEDAIIWLQEVASILDFIHQSGVAHLNIQPLSLIQHRDGRKLITNLALVENAILTDFKAWQSSVNSDLFPLHQPSKTNFQRDIYALGQTIIYALTNSFCSSIEETLLDAAEAVTPENVDQDNLSKIDISPKLTNILHKMVDKNSQKCYQDIGQVLEDLDFSHNVITFPPPFFDSSGLPASPSARIKKGNSKTVQPITLQFKQTQKALWLWLSIPFVIASIIVFIGINKNSQNKFFSYVNDDYQFSIKYPQHWSQRQLDDPITGDIVVFASPQETDSDLFLEKLYIAVEYLPSEPISLEQYTQDVFERINQDKGSKLDAYEDYQTTVDKLPARKVIYSRQEEGLQLKQMETFTIRNNQVYIAIYTAERAKFSKFHNTVEQMIESWKIQS
ncbi:MAG: PsbP-related protein [Cyanobacteria bacterium P01_A01_bin.40]